MLLYNDTACEPTTMTSILMHQLMNFMLESASSYQAGARLVHTWCTSRLRLKVNRQSSTTVSNLLQGSKSPGISMVCELAGVYEGTSRLLREGVAESPFLSADLYAHVT